MRTALLFAPYYFPSNNVGAVRPGKFVKYLPSFGWQLLVVTPEQHEHEAYLEGDSSNIFYVQFPDLEKIFKLGRQLIPKPKAHFKVRSEALPIIEIDSRRQAFLDWVLLPDEKITWISSAVKKGLTLAKSHSIDIVITTAPYFSTHLIGLSLARRLNRPWLADFRDPWVTSPYIYYPTKLHRKIHAILERKVVESANVVLSTTELMNQDLITRYPKLPVDKFKVVYNGYDDDDFVDLKPQTERKDSKIQIIQNGTFYGERSPIPFLKALKHFDDSDLNRLSVIFVGKNVLPWQSIVDELGLNSVVKLKDMVPYQQCLQLLQESDILLLIPGGQLILPKKLFEYLKLEKWILAVSANPMVNGFLEQINVSKIADPASPQDIYCQLSNLMALIDQGVQPEPNLSLIQQFEFKNLTGQLAQILDKMAYPVES
ncbi:MAG: glycosyltransferase [Anaerolineae bacterium]|nr:glycosyltransferase [Anaerolineae bacterium]